MSIRSKSRAELAALSAAALTVGCHDQAPSDKAVMNEASKLAHPLPGLYRSTTRLTSFELPGADPESADIVHDRLSRVAPQQRQLCVTPQAAANGFKDLIKQSQQGDCTIERFVANKSRLSARLSCHVGPKLASTVSLEGTGEPTRSHIDLTLVQTGPSIPGGSETIGMTVDNQRIGDCPK